MESVSYVLSGPEEVPCAEWEEGGLPLNFIKKIFDRNIFPLPIVINGSKKGMQD